MKEELEKEICILAEKIIKNRGNQDFSQLKTELGKIYEKVSILSFVEKYYQSLGTSESRMQYTMGKVADFINKQQSESDVFDIPVEYSDVQPMKFGNIDTAAKRSDVAPSYQQQANVAPKQTQNYQSPPVQQQPLSAYDSYQQMVQEASAKQSYGSNRQNVNSQSEADNYDEIIHTARFSQPLQSVQQEPEWVKPSVQERKPLESYISQSQQLVFDKKEEAEPKQAHSINDHFGKNVQIGLNDRLAFIRQLFFGSESEYNKVVQNINSLGSVQEIALYIEQEVKPVYNHWRGKEEYEERFLNLMLKRFEM